MKHILIGLSLLAFFGCTKAGESTTGAENTTKTTDNISLSVFHEQEFAVKGIVAESESAMKTVGMYGHHTKQNDWNPAIVTNFNKMNNGKFTYNTTTYDWDWATDISQGDQPWWEYESITDKYTFYAYSPYATGVYNVTTNPTGNGVGLSVVDGQPQITYTVPSICVNQPDLLVAQPRKNIYPVAGGRVGMKFSHTLANVQFFIKGNLTDTRITSITLKDVLSTATLSFIADGTNAFNWSTPTAAQDFTISVDGGELETIVMPALTSTQITSSQGNLFMIPQTIGLDGIPLEVIIEDVVTNATETHNLVITAGTQWKAGIKYNYIINFSRGVEPTIEAIAWNEELGEFFEPEIEFATHKFDDYL